VQALLQVIGVSRNDKGIVPFESRQVLLDALIYNDNSLNEFSDQYLISTLLTSICDSFLPEDVTLPPEQASRKLEMSDVEILNFQGKRNSPTLANNTETAFLKLIFKEFERMRDNDRLAPSYHNIITNTVLQVFSVL
jgi:hypothetical protein